LVQNFDHVPEEVDQDQLNVQLQGQGENQAIARPIGQGAGQNAEILMRGPPGEFASNNIRPTSSSVQSKFSVKK
jgi:hypothetical protein